MSCNEAAWLFYNYNDNPAADSLQEQRRRFFTDKYRLYVNGAFVP